MEFNLKSAIKMMKFFILTLSVKHSALFAADKPTKIPTPQVVSSSKKNAADKNNEHAPALSGELQTSAKKSSNEQAKTKNTLPSGTKNQEGSLNKQIITAKNDKKDGQDEMTLGMFDRTQQEILLLQSQLELSKLKQQISDLAQKKRPARLEAQTSTNFSLIESEMSNESKEKKIILMYTVGNQRFVRVQVGQNYQQDMQEGEVFPDGDVLLKIENNSIILRNENKKNCRIFIV